MHHCGWHLLLQRLLSRRPAQPPHPPLPWHYQHRHHPPTRSAASRHHAASAQLLWSPDDHLLLTAVIVMALESHRCRQPYGCWQRQQQQQCHDE
jgi:hypothetical protein